MNACTRFLIGWLATTLAEFPVQAQAPEGPSRASPPSPLSSIQQAPPSPNYEPPDPSLPIPNYSTHDPEGFSFILIGWGTGIRNSPVAGIRLGGGYRYSDDSTLELQGLGGPEPLDLVYRWAYYETESCRCSALLGDCGLGVKQEVYLGHGFAVSIDTLANFGEIGALSLVWYMNEIGQIEVRFDPIACRIGMTVVVNQ